MLLVAAHLLLAWVRMPRSIIKKLTEIHEYEELGAAAFPFRGHAPESARIVERLLESTPEDALLYYEGDFKGDLELAAALLYPRLLIRYDPDRPGRRSALGRSIARLPSPEGDPRFPVLLGKTGRPLALRWR